MLQTVPISAHGGGPGRREWEGRCCGDQATAHAKGSVGALAGPERATCGTIATHPHAATTMLAGLRAEESCALVCPRACRPRGRRSSRWYSAAGSTHAAVARSSLVLCCAGGDREESNGAAGAGGRSLRSLSSPLVWGKNDELRSYGL